MPEAQPSAASRRGTRAELAPRFRDRVGMLTSVPRRHPSPGVQPRASLFGGRDGDGVTDVNPKMRRAHVSPSEQRSRDEPRLADGDREPVQPKKKTALNMTQKTPPEVHPPEPTIHGPISLLLGRPPGWNPTYLNLRWPIERSIVARKGRVHRASDHLKRCPTFVPGPLLDDDPETGPHRGRADDILAPRKHGRFIQTVSVCR